MGRCLSKLDHGKRSYGEDSQGYITPVEIVRDVIPNPEEGPAGAEPTDSHQRNTVPKAVGPPPCPGPQSESLSAIIFANRRFLENINVDSVLDHLHFIDDPNLRSNRTALQTTRVDMLLEAIRKSKENRKWNKFVEALRKSDHRFVADQVTQQTSEHHDHLKTILRIVSPRIIDRAYVSDMLDILFERNVLNAEDKETILSEERNTNEMNACRLMLNLIPRRAHDWYGILKETLRQCDMSDIADAMKKYEMELAMEESRRESQSENQDNFNIATDQDDKIPEKHPFRETYTEPHPDVEKLQTIRNELRNVIYNMKHKYHITEMEMRLVEELKQILEEIQPASIPRADRNLTNTGNDRNSGTPTRTGNDTNERIEEPDVRLNVDTSNTDLPHITQVVVKKAACVQMRLNDENVQDILKAIDDKYQALKELAVRHNQSLSDLTDLMTTRREDGCGQSDWSSPYLDVDCIAADSDEEYASTNF